MTKPKYVELKSRRWRFLSWGVGVQSTTLAVMSVLGDVPAFDAIIFADTQRERAGTYQAFEFYSAWLRERGARVERVTVGDIRVQGIEEHRHIPFWTGAGGPLRRQCTPYFKVQPAQRLAREIAGFDASRPPHPGAGQFSLSIGISLDEWERMSTNEVKYIHNDYPLVSMSITRAGCEDYLRSHGLPVPIKSACVFCPYRAASEWAEMRETSPGEWQEAIAFDEANRENPLAESAGSTVDRLYIYKSGGKAQPLRLADLEADAKRERKGKQLPLMVCVGGYCHT